MIYLDSAATTPLSPDIKSELSHVYAEFSGNNSSKHELGQKAAAGLQWARETIAAHLNLPTNTVYFTSGATESANTLLQGYTNFLKQTNSERNEIIISGIEHPAIHDTALALRRSGFSTHFVNCNQDGHINLGELINLITPKTAIVSIIHTNNETGVIQDINKIAELVKNKDPQILFMTDIVQALCKIQLNFRPNIDCFFASGHKFGAPKGIGFFHIKQNFRIFPLMYGGGQEDSYRSGTVNTPSAILMAKALEKKFQHLETNFQHASNLKNSFIKALQTDYIINFNLNHTSPYILSIAFPKIRGSELADNLSKKQIYISTKSACSSNSHSKSRVLENSNVSADLIDHTVRISFLPETTIQEVEKAATTINEIISTS